MPTQVVIPRISTSEAMERLTGTWAASVERVRRLPALHITYYTISFCSLLLPTIPLTEAEIAKYYDNTMKSETLRIAILRNVTPNIKRVKACVETGGNPMDIDIGSNEAKDTAGKGAKGQTLAYTYPLTNTHFTFFLCS